MTNKGRRLAGRPTASTLLLWTLLTTCGCEPNSRSPILQPTGSTRQPGSDLLTIDPDSPGYNPQTGRLEIEGAIDETLTFGLHLRAALKPVTDVVVTVAPRSATGAAAVDPKAVNWFRLHAIRIPPDATPPGWQVRLVEPARRRREIHDVLVPIDAPRGGLPASVQPGETLRLFAELRISKGTAPGVYEADVRIAYRGGPPFHVPLRVTVWPFLLPRDSAYSFLATLDHHQLFRQHVRIDGEPYAPMRLRGDPRVNSTLDGLLNSTIRLLQIHGVTPVLDGVYPIVKIDSRMEVSVDWEDFDRTLEAYYDGTGVYGGSRPAWCRIPFDSSFPSVGDAPFANDSARTSITEAYLAQCSSHFAERGWLERAYLEALEPNLPSPEALDHLRYFARRVRRAADRLPLMTRWFPHDPLDPEWPDRLRRDGSPFVDIWCPPGQYRVPSEGSDGPQKWFRVDRPPYTGTLNVEAPETFVRVIPWQARRYGIRTVDLGAAIAWPSRDPPVTPQSCITFNPSTLLYPGSAFGLNYPLASMRLKRLRRGVDDLRYLKLLEVHGLEHVAETLVESLSPYAFTDAYRNHSCDVRPCGWVQDPDLWVVARRIMADEIRLRIGDVGHTLEGGASQEQDLRLAMTVRWREFMGRARTCRLSVDGIRVRPTRKPGTNRIEVTVTIDNRTRTPVGGRLFFPDLPMGWTVLEPGLIVSPVGPLQTKRVTLIAEAEGNMAWDESGLTHVLIRLRTPGGETYETQARLACIASQRRQDPIAIDGVLSDWPVGAWNVAADFRSITGAVPAATRPAPDRTVGRTRGFVLHDDAFLYIAFHCTTDSPPKAARSHRNTVHYEDMIPVGEDLVEILIDPTNAGTHAAEDLYHIVIKRGAALFERGIATDPPIGPRSIWSADIRYATRASSNTWVIELRIPRDAFGEDHSGLRIWGINFARYDASRREYSNWSGAVHNAYDPLSLGNLMLP